MTDDRIGYLLRRASLLETEEAELVDGLPQVRKDLASVLAELERLEAERGG